MRLRWKKNGTKWGHQLSGYLVFDVSLTSLLELSWTSNKNYLNLVCKSIGIKRGNCCQNIKLGVPKAQKE